MAWIGAVVGALGSYMSAKEANKSKKTSTNMTTTSEPWQPSVPYRQEALGRIYNMRTGNSPLSTPNYLPQNNAGNGNQIRRVDPNAPGDIDPSVSGDYTMRNFGTASSWNPQDGGAADPWRPTGLLDMPSNQDYGVDTSWSGASDMFGNSQPIMDRLSSRALNGHQLYDPSNQFTQSLLEGGSQNPYFDQAFDAYSGYGGDSDLARFKAMLFNGEMPGSGASGSGGVSRGGGGGARTAVTPDLVGAKGYMQEILNGTYDGARNPYMDAMIAARNKSIGKSFRENAIPGINDEFSGAGRFGGGLYATALGDASGQYATALADSENQLRYSDFEQWNADRMAALGYANQYDMNSIDSAAQLEGSLASSAASSGASAYAADRSAQTQLALARMGALQDAIGMGLDAEQFGMSGMGNLAGQYSQNQLAALGLVPDLTGQDIRDLQAAGGMGLEMDTRRNNARAEAAAQRAEAAAQQRADQFRWAQFNWDREQTAREEPWRREMQYADLLNAYSGNYGRTVTSGYGTAPGAGVSEWGQAIQGGLAGWNAARSSSRRSSTARRRDDPGVIQ